MLNRPVGERFEYSNLNFVLLGAVLQAVSGRSWQALVQAQVFQPLQMMRSYTDHDAGRQAGMTDVHRMWFGLPVAQRVELLPGFAPAGSLVSSAGDMSRYLAILLAEGAGPGGQVVSQQGVAQLLAPVAPLRRFKLRGGRLRVPLRRRLVGRTVRSRDRCALAPRRSCAVRGLDGAAAGHQADRGAPDQRQQLIAL